MKGGKIVAVFNPFRPLSSLRNVLQVKRDRDLNSGWFGDTFSLDSTGKIIRNPSSVTPQKALTNSDIWAVINRISGDIAGGKFTADAYQNILKEPFHLQNSDTGWKSVLIQLLLYGNAYVAIHRNDSRQVSWLEPVPTSIVVPKLLTGGKEIEYTVYYSNFEDGVHDMIYSSSDMLHFRISPTGGSDTKFMGTSPLLSLAQDLGVQDQSKRLMIAAMAHAIAPTAIYKSQSVLSPKEREQIRQSIQSSVTGQKAGQVLVVDANGDFEQSNGLTPDISNLITNANYTQTQVAKAFGIPDSYLNGQGDQQSSLEMIKGLYQNSLATYIHALESELSYKLGTTVNLDLSRSVDMSGDSYINHVDTLTKDGIITPRQAQQLLVSRGVLPGLADTDDYQTMEKTGQPPATLLKGSDNNGNEDTSNTTD